MKAWTETFETSRIQKLIKTKRVKDYQKASSSNSSLLPKTSSGVVIANQFSIFSVDCLELCDRLRQAPGIPCFFCHVNRSARELHELF